MSSRVSWRRDGHVVALNWQNSGYLCVQNKLSPTCAKGHRTAAWRGPVQHRQGLLRFLPLYRSLFTAGFNVTAFVSCQSPLVESEKSLHKVTPPFYRRYRRRKEAAAFRIPRTPEHFLVGAKTHSMRVSAVCLGGASELNECLAKDIAHALAEPDMREWLAKHGAVPMTMTQPEFALFVQSESESAARLIESAR